MLHGLIYSDCGWCYICNFDEICLWFWFLSSPRVSPARSHSFLSVLHWELGSAALVVFNKLSLTVPEQFGLYVLIQDDNIAEFSRWPLPLSHGAGGDFQVCSCRVACAVTFCDKAEGRDLVLLITHLGGPWWNESWYCLCSAQSLQKHPLPMAGGWN